MPYKLTSSKFASVALAKLNIIIPSSFRCGFPPTLVESLYMRSIPPEWSCVVC